MIYAQSLLIFGDFGFENHKDQGEVKSIERIANLLVGVELLSSGITFHYFSKDDRNAYPAKTITEKEDKKYNLDLLFGDIFYSRAVPYLLRFKDHMVFDKILKSLKNTHRHRLELHQKILKSIGISSPELRKFKENKDLFMGVNSLLESSFEVGKSIFDPNNIFNAAKEVKKIIDNIIILKFYCDIKDYFNSISPTAYSAGEIEFIISKINFIKSILNDNISELKSRKLAENFMIFMEIF